MEYDAPTGDFVELKPVVTPSAEFTVTQEDQNKQRITFTRPLQQDQTYLVEFYRTLRSYRVGTNQSLQVGAREKINSLSFKTVTAPLISSSSPSGNQVQPTEEIKIIFDQEMNRQSVESLFEITPRIKGGINWEDNRTFVFTPAEPLLKETKYQLLFKKGILNRFGAKIEKDINLEFETIGKVKVIAASPSYGAQINTTSLDKIAIEFDQEVDRPSAEARFSISPAIGGNISWESKKMTFNLARNLAYSTRYDLRVNPGVKAIYGLDSQSEFASYFTTPKQTFTLDVPQYYQDPKFQTFNCNLVAAQMVLAYRGINVTQEEVKSAIGVGQNPDINWVEGYGTHAGPIASYLESRGLSIAIKTGWNLTDLAKEIENGHPVILWWYNRYSQPKGVFTLPGGYTGYKGMHGEVARGFVGSSSNPTELLTNDPWRGRLVYDQSLFLATWSYLNYTAIVVY